MVISAVCKFFGVRHSHFKKMRGPHRRQIDIAVRARLTVDQNLPPRLDSLKMKNPLARLRRAALLLRDFGEPAPRLLSYIYRCFRQAPAALQKSLHVVAKQIALGSNQFLRGPTSH